MDPGDDHDDRTIVLHVLSRSIAIHEPANEATQGKDRCSRYVENPGSVKHQTAAAKAQPEIGTAALAGVRLLERLCLIFVESTSRTIVLVSRPSPCQAKLNEPMWGWVSATEKARRRKYDCSTTRLDQISE
jgi:hypothetical protein